MPAAAATAEAATAIDRPIVEVAGLRKHYGSTVALAGIDLSIGRGEVVAILGPNGAGKTTLVEILEGYRAPTAGEVSVLGARPDTAPPAWRDRIGVVLQEGAVLPDLTVAEAIEMYRAYYRRPRPLDDVLEVGGLGAARDTRVRRLSGGQRRRLDLSLAVVGSPDLLFLDEPTTGFDPEARREAWGVIGALVRDGTTVVLTTHYLDEADALADRIVVIVDGRVAADGSSEELMALGDDRATIRFRVDGAPELATCPVALTVDGPWAQVVTATATETLHALTTWARRAHVDLPGLTVSRPSLEARYLELVSR